MNPRLRNILSVVAGAGTCLVLNGLLLGSLMKLMPPPPGFDANVPSTYHLLEARHYLSPFLAHALPTVVGAIIAALLAATKPLQRALTVGALHLAGGIAAAFMIPAPAWFTALDLLVAYLPMAWLGWRLVGGKG